jgi:hypothetical protein
LVGNATVVVAEMSTCCSPPPTGGGDVSQFNIYMLA